MYTFKQRSNRQYVSSTIIYFIEYDDSIEQLKIGFNDGSIGFFSAIPSNLFSEFESAESKGDFFQKNILKAGYKSYFEAS